MLHRILPLAAVATSAVLLAGCTATAPSAPAAQQTAGSTSAATPSGGVVSANPKQQGAEAAGIDLTNPPAAIASVKAPYSGSERIKDVTVELIELRKRDKVLYGIFRITNSGDYTGTKNVYQLLGNSWEPSLLDTKNLKEYRPISELTRGGSISATANQPLYATAAWGYPDSAETVDIRIDSQFPLLEGIRVP